MAGAYSLIGLILCVRLVVQTEGQPLFLAAAYAFGHFIVLPLAGYHWLIGIFFGLFAFGPTYVYLRALEILSGWKFWAALPLGCLVVMGASFAAEQFCALFGLDINGP